MPPARHCRCHIARCDRPKATPAAYDDGAAGFVTGARCPESPRCSLPRGHGHCRWTFPSPPGHRRPHAPISTPRPGDIAYPHRAAEPKASWTSRYCHPASSLKIPAGEADERSASLVKELVDDAIDGGTVQITVACEPDDAGIPACGGRLGKGPFIPQSLRKAEMVGAFAAAYNRRPPKPHLKGAAKSRSAGSVGGLVRNAGASAEHLNAGSGSSPGRRKDDGSATARLPARQE